MAVEFREWCVYGVIVFSVLILFRFIVLVGALAKSVRAVSIGNILTVIVLVISFF